MEEAEEEQQHAIDLALYGFTSYLICAQVGSQAAWHFSLFLPSYSPESIISKDCGRPQD